MLAVKGLQVHKKNQCYVLHGRLRGSEITELSKYLKSPAKAIVTTMNHFSLLVKTLYAV